MGHHHAHKFPNVAVGYGRRPNGCEPSPQHNRGCLGWKHVSNMNKRLCDYVLGTCQPIAISGLPYNGAWKQSYPGLDHPNSHSSVL